MRLIGERVRELRESLGLTQTELAHRAGMTWETVNRIETGKTWHPRRATMEKLALALGLNAGDLFELAPNAKGIEDKLPGRIALLTAEERRVVEVLVRALLRKRGVRERSVSEPARKGTVPPPVLRLEAGHEQD